jgi:hypothetical protein
LVVYQLRLPIISHFKTFAILNPSIVPAGGSGILRSLTARRIAASGMPAEAMPCGEPILARLRRGNRFVVVAAIGRLLMDAS